MAIHLITGIPGHGKTATLVKLLREAAEREQAKAARGEPARPIYAAGIDGLQPGLAEPLEDPTKWRDVPEGSIIFVDEAWKWFGHLHDASRRAAPPHVMDLAEHRHYGIDFYWTSQGPGQIYPFARPLIGPHWHCVRKFGTLAMDLYKWGELVEDVKGQAMRDRAEKDTTLIPKQSFGLYKSASLHTYKPALPWKVWMIPACIVGFILAAWIAYRTLSPDAMAAKLTGEAASGGAAAAFVDLASPEPSSERRRKPLSPEEWLQRVTPRFPGMHESMPIFDEREAAAVPRRFCVISGEPDRQVCNCYTEQVTPLRDVPPGVCVQVARWGEYDPFRAPPEADDRGGPDAPGERQPRRAVGTATKPGDVGSPAQGQVWGVQPETLRASGS